MAGFAEIIGHEQIIEHLQNAILSQKVSHAYILNGPDDSGKKMIAEAFAMALQCEKHGTEGCMECHSCKQAISKNQPDIIYVTHEKPNTISVDDIRRQVKDDVDIKPYASPYKIYIIDEAGKNECTGAECIVKNDRRAAGICGHSLIDNQCRFVSANDKFPLHHTGFKSSAK